MKVCILINQIQEISEFNTKQRLTQLQDQQKDYQQGVQQLQGTKNLLQLHHQVHIYHTMDYQQEDQQLQESKNLIQLHLQLHIYHTMDHQQEVQQNLLSR